MADGSRQTTPESQLHDSQRDDLGSSPIKHTVPQVAIDKRDKWSQYVYGKVHTQMEPEEMLSKLCPKYEEINGVAPNVTEMQTTKAGSSQSTYCEYLNLLSTFVQNSVFCILRCILWL
jgi:hypothetical protein